MRALPPPTGLRRRSSGTHGKVLRTSWRQQRLIRNLTLALGAMTFVGTLVALYLVDRNAANAPESQAVSAADLTTVAGIAPVATNATTRLIYRHSIVPGGVRSAQEVVQAMARDAVVAAHYAGVNPDAIRAVQLSEPLQVHVSYRIGNAVYWTRKPLTLAAGETVLTDGTKNIRARCGNLLSVEPLGPSLEDEPAPPEFDLVIAPLMPARPDVVLGSPPPPLPPPAAPPSNPDPPVTHEFDPPVPVPEPGTSVLVGLGLAAAGIWRYLRKSPTVQ